MRFCEGLWGPPDLADTADPPGPASWTTWGAPVPWVAAEERESSLSPRSPVVPRQVPASSRYFLQRRQGNDATAHDVSWGDTDATVGEKTSAI